MPERRSEPEIEWDFSFVGDPTDDRRAEPAKSGAAEVDWDFSFVDDDRAAEDRRRQVRGQPISPRPNGVDDVQWDFSFVGEPTHDQPEAAPNPGRAEEGVEWDFSFVSDEHEPSAPARATPSAQPEHESPAVSFERDSASDDGPLDDHVEPLERDRLAAAGPADGDRALTDQTAAADHDRLVDQIEADAHAAPADDQLDLGLPPIDRVADSPHGVVDTEPASAETIESGSGPIPGQLELDDVAPTDELDRPSMLDEFDPTPISTASALDVAVPAQPDPPRREAPTARAMDSTPVEATAPPIDPVKVLTVCTHNRTRSVMMMGLLQEGFDKAVGPGRVMVRSLGFGPEGEPPIADAVDEMAERGIDVSAHRSLQVTGPRVEPADLILTAERDHVAKIAEASPDAFRRTFTLPEFCRSIAHDPVPGNRSLREWLHSMSSARTPAEYLSADVPEVDDPTGSPKRQFAAATVTIESMCDTVVDLLEVSVGRPNWRGNTADQG